MTPDVIYKLYSVFKHKQSIIAFYGATGPHVKPVQRKAVADSVFAAAEDNVTATGRVRGAGAASAFAPPAL